MRNRLGFLVLVVLAAWTGPGAVPAARAGQAEIALRLAPGRLRLALPSPDGRRLAVLGGKGEAGPGHTVIVLDYPCGADSVRRLTVTRSASFTPTPPKVPTSYLALQWSPDGTRLFAAGVVYEITEDGGKLAAKNLYTLERPVLDFRFGPGEKAAGVEVEYARVREIRRGEQALVVKLAYRIYSLKQGIAAPVQAPEKYAIAWVPKEWPPPPAVSWEPDGGLLLFYPYHDRTEYLKPGKARRTIQDRRPSPRAEPGLGPFRFREPCDTEWTLLPGPPADRVRVKRR